ncbi:SDR family NAD(P)-dependent oxidoreductase [Anaerotruncus sp. AF02-27]|jgi:NAD(P)-dependent dehydrogenase (short-subunit alcohol dehydrogenase family)|uniref:SDR family NAD(P)-dependent oxidoreductase n=1 Tax=Anaerotruncus TaxID=244127 RepID=UPI000E494820|nr:MULTISPECIES: SDR family NAD(P)-dependent oxidoreductase [Anaerotruncus]RGX56847.1 SDR family NAD(P)-dependent oxidoreductase [Anaerotruncus sp. AF02-27]
MEAKLIEKAMYDYFKLVGKTAIVTGAGNGIGQGIAKVLAGLGVNVVACDIEEDSVKGTADGITQAGGTCIGMYCDVRKYEDIQKVIQTAIDKFGTVDILVNDAAGCGGGVTVDTINEEEWMRLIELNLNSVYRFTISVLPLMRAKKSGKIINISSGAGITGDFSDPHYAAAKGGVIAFTKEIAHEVAKDRINVNSVAPGLVDTRMARIRPWEDEIADTLWHRVGQPEDIAYAVAYLASSASDYLTGQVISPNGGAWMQ